jgi:hypothetical protein
MSPYASSRIPWKMLAIGVLLPFVTGFDNEAPKQTYLLAPPNEHSQLLQSQSQLPPETTPPDKSFQWRREPVRLAASEIDQTPVRLAASETDRTETESAKTPEVRLNWETGAGKSYLVPAVEIPGFLVLLNLYDRVAYPNERTRDGDLTYSSNFSTTWNHLRKQNWDYDTDPFNVNQFAHPYQGATMYGLARSSGLGFWESWAYSNAGSFLWKMAGETERPSINDMATTGNSGSLLGEALFRMSALVLRDAGPEPDVWHKIGAAIISPTTAVNRFAFGDRFKEVFPSNDPATFWRLRFGASLNGNSQQAGTLDFRMSYGLPGKPGYSYTRPLDYFDFQISGLSTANNPISDVLLRGLLYGKKYQAGEDYRGIWGLYGSYDYISPSIFRVSNTALSLGTTGQYWLMPGLALQGSILAGVGYGAAGVTPAPSGDRDYHYGVTPQEVVALRLIFGDRVALETVGRDYFVSGTGSDNVHGSENIVRVNMNFTVRVYGRHGVGIQYVESIRDAKYGSLPGKHQSDGTVSLVYTFLGDSHLGAVDWREHQ